MNAIFSDSIFGITMYVSLCEYIYEMEQFKLKVGRWFALISNRWREFDLFVTGRSHFVIERELAIIQQCHDHTDKRSFERSHRCTRLCLLVSLC